MKNKIDFKILIMFTILLTNNKMMVRRKFTEIFFKGFGSNNIPKFNYHDSRMKSFYQAKKLREKFLNSKIGTKKDLYDMENYYFEKMEKRKIINLNNN